MSKRIPRRTVLKGVGATLALPLLDAMTPRSARAAAAEKPPVRLLFAYVPMGVNLDQWTPKDEGNDYELSPTLAPLAKVKDDVLVLSGLDHRREDPAGNPHPRGSSTWLSTAGIGELDSGGFCTAATVDQLAARAIGKSTRLPSLELAPLRGTSKYSCNIAWRAPGAPVSPTVNPRQVYLRLFGDPKGDLCRRKVLDRVLDDARNLRDSLGVADRQKLDEYLEAVRSVERQIDSAGQLKEKPQLDIPEAATLEYRHTLKLMNELLVLAFRTDTTRVATIMYALENGGAPVSYRFLGVPEDHHGLTHFSDANKQQCLDKIALIDRFNVEHLALMLESLKNTPDGHGSLLDNSLVVYGSGIGWGNKHNWDNVPILLAGKGGGAVSGGRHVRYSKGTPLANLYLSLLEQVGAKQTRIADSTGPLTNLVG